MATKKNEEVKKEKPVKPIKAEQKHVPQRSRKLLDLRQYLLNKDIRRETVAAIRIEHGDEHHTRQDWNEIIAEYTRRQN